MTKAGDRILRSLKEAVAFAQGDASAGCVVYSPDSEQERYIVGSNFELNKGDQFIVAFDISGSMQTKDCPGDQTRFAYVGETMKVFIAQAAQWDPDGVSFYSFNNRCTCHPNVQTVDEINQIIASLKPGGGTATHLAIGAAYEEHKAHGSDQTFLLIFTDGEPSEPDKVKNAIINITNNVKDEKEFRLSILTVGQRTPELNAWLTALDDDLTGAKYDIVSVDELDNVDFETAVNNAIEG